MTKYRVDGVVVVTNDADRVTERWESLLAAAPDETVLEPSLNARRTRLRLGSGAVDILSPTGPGIVADAFKKRGEHLFASAISAADNIATIDRRAQAGAAKLTDGSVLLTGSTLGIDGIAIVVRPAANRQAVGRIKQWYEATVLVDDTREAVAAVSRVLGLDRSFHRVLASDEFRYDGVLTLFGADELSRFEIVTPWSESSTMNRFYKKNGQCFYMAFGESDDLAAVGDLLTSAGFDFASHSRDGNLTELWVPPAALGGVMVGLSVPDEAWRWSSGELAFTESGPATELHGR
jgi:hypothetical protein